MIEKIKKLELEIESINEKEKQLKEKKKNIIKQKAQYEQMIQEQKDKEVAIDNAKIVASLREQLGEITSENINEIISALQ